MVGLNGLLLGGDEEEIERKLVCRNSSLKWFFQINFVERKKHEQQHSAEVKKFKLSHDIIYHPKYTTNTNIWCLKKSHSANYSDLVLVISTNSSTLRFMHTDEVELK